MVSSLDLQPSNTSSNLVGNATMLLWYMGYDTGAQAGEDGSSPSRGLKYGFVVPKKTTTIYVAKKNGFVVFR